MDLYGNKLGKGGVIKLQCPDGLSARDIVSVDGLSGVDMYVVDFKQFAAERFGIMSCFANRTYLFSYGHDVSQSRSSVSCLVMFGTNGCDPGDGTGAVQSLVSFYNTNRLSKKSGKTSIKILKSGLFSKGYLVSFQLGGYSAELNAAVVTFTYICTDE